MSWKKSEQFPIAILGEEFFTLTEACYAYGISPRFVSQFYKTSENLKDALLNALRYKDIQSFYGMTMCTYNKAIEMLKDNAPLDRKMRVIKIQRASKFEEIDSMGHEVVKNKFVTYITKRDKYCREKKKMVYT